MKYQACRNMMFNQFRKADSTSIQFFTAVNVKANIYHKILVPTISEYDYWLSKCAVQGESLHTWPVFLLALQIRTAISMYLPKS